MNIRKLIGTKEFYRSVLIIAVPIMLQNGISNFVNLLDNIMVGQTGTDPMSGVAIVNQIIFVFNLCIFGGTSGAGLFTAQFAGKGDHKGVRDTFRFKLILCVFLGIVGIGVFSIWGDALIGMFLHEGSETGSLADTLAYGKDYLAIMLLGLIPFALSTAYASTLRETGETVLPMIAGVSAVLVNLVFNYILIFGHFGAPQMGVAGAAIATVLSRFVELAIVVGWTHTHKEKNPFAVGVFKQFHIPKNLVKDIFVTGMPLLVNEFLWASGVMMLTRFYSTRGLAAVAALNINNTINNVFNIVYLSLGSSVSIIIGQLLGAGKMKEAKEKDAQLITFSFFTSIVFGLLLMLISPFFPQLYNTTNEVKVLASGLILVIACCAPLNAITNASYFTLRSGGKTYITFLFDSVFMWCANVFAAFLLSTYTDLPLIPLFAICQSIDVFKCAIGLMLVKKGIWVRNIVTT